MKVYLDNAATTMMDARVRKAMDFFCSRRLGNAASLHRSGVWAAVAVEKARQIIARRINADSKDVYFTSGGTESNNWAIKGIAFSRKRKGSHIIVSAIEHPSILETAQWLREKGFKISYLGVDQQGFVDPDVVRRSLTGETILVSVMHANNEIGTIEPIDKIGKLCRREGVCFHVDACQSFTKIPLDVKRDCLDLVTLNSHKIHGPHGVGALYVRKGIEIEPIMHGGGQENGRRAGTVNSESIVGFGKAVELSALDDAVNMTSMRDYVIKEIETRLTDVFLNGPRRSRVCNNINLAFKGVDGKQLFLALNKRNIYVSMGSACSSNSLTVSHVLLALKISTDMAHGAIRMSLSKFTSRQELDYVIGVIVEIVNRSRRRKV